MGDPDEDRTRLVHVVSRTAGREILFADDEKEEFRKILFKQIKFSGLRALALREGGFTPVNPSNTANACFDPELPARILADFHG